MEETGSEKNEKTLEERRENYQGLRRGVAYLGLIVAVVLCATGKAFLGLILGILFFEPIIELLPLNDKNREYLEHSWIVSLMFALVVLLMFASRL